MLTLPLPVSLIGQHIEEERIIVVRSSLKYY